MIRSEVKIGGARYPLYSLNTLIIGSGAAALNAALVLHELGERRIADRHRAVGGGDLARRRLGQADLLQNVRGRRSRPIRPSKWPGIFSRAARCTATSPCARPWDPFRPSSV